MYISACTKQAVYDGCCASLLVELLLGYFSWPGMGSPMAVFTLCWWARSRISVPPLPSISGWTDTSHLWTGLPHRGWYSLDTGSWPTLPLTAVHGSCKIIVFGQYMTQDTVCLTTGVSLSEHNLLALVSATLMNSHRGSIPQSLRQLLPHWVPTSHPSPSLFWISPKKIWIVMMSQVAMMSILLIGV